ETLMKAFVAARLRLKASGMRVMENATGQDVEGMQTLYRGEDQANYNAVIQAVMDDITFNSAEGRKAADRGATTYRSARLETIIAMVLCGLLCAAAGYAINTGVARPIQLTTKTVEQLASGDLQVDVAGAERLDE